MTSQEYFDQLILEIPDAKAGKMFGVPCAKMPNGKAGMMLKNDELIVKILPPEAEKENFSVFTPIENRPMNGWYVIPFEKQKLWKKYAEISCSQAALMETKKSKK